MRTAILGASGLVGRTMLHLLQDRDWITEPPLLLTSERSAGGELPFRDTRLTCQAVTPELLADLDIVLMSAGGSTSMHWSPQVAAAGAWAIDNSSAFRQDPGVPLVVPEINGKLLGGVRVGPGENGGLIANPNCSTIQIAMAVAPLDRTFGVQEVHVTTLQAVSGGGQKAVAELRRQSATARGDDKAAAEESSAESPFPRVIASNVFPEIGPAKLDGSFDEEAKVERELRKIMSRGKDLHVICTAIRVPVHTGHSATVRLVCREEIDPDEAYIALDTFPGVKVTPEPHEYHTPREVAGTTDVYVGRLRPDPGNPRALLMWVVADNLLKGAAWNALQIADRLVAGSKA